MLRAIELGSNHSSDILHSKPNANSQTQALHAATARAQIAFDKTTDATHDGLGSKQSSDILHSKTNASSQTQASHAAVSMAQVAFDQPIDVTRD